MQEHHKQIDDFFHKVSRYIFIVPMIVVLAAVLLKLADNSAQKGYREYNLSPTPTKSQNIFDGLDSSASAKFNLTGPLSCSFSTQTSSVSAYVKDKKIYIAMDEKNVKTNHLLNGDCVYIWKEGQYSGEKTCGISQQVSIVEGLLSSGLIDPSLVFSNLGKAFDLPVGVGKQDTLKTAMSSCKKEDVPSSIGFNVPKSVLFKNKAPK